MLDLFYPSQSIDNFWVAEKDGKIVGVIRFEEHDNFFFLSSLGVKPAERKQGVASALVEKLLGSANKNVYLYTAIPDFFQKFGFQTTQPPNHLPSKSGFQCEECFPDRCVCMVKSPNAA